MFDKCCKGINTNCSGMKQHAHIPSDNEKGMLFKKSTSMARIDNFSICGVMVQQEEPGG